MRKIIFRGRTSKGEWLHGDLSQIDGKCYIFPREEGFPLNSPDFFEVEAGTVGEYVGMCDKTEKDMYEGDLYMFTNGTYNGNPNTKGPYLAGMTTGIAMGAVWSSIEITGNIHDTPPSPAQSE